MIHQMNLMKRNFKLLKKVKKNLIYLNKKKYPIYLQKKKKINLQKIHI
jgi:hypothetical protein